MKKVSLGGRKIVLKGQTTDSGGGGVLDLLADECWTNTKESIANFTLTR